jgi:hypothetical protein
MASRLQVSLFASATVFIADLDAALLFGALAALYMLAGGHGCRMLLVSDGCYMFRSWPKPFSSHQVASQYMSE